MSFPKYPAYKDSCVQWIGELPSHWQVTAVAYRYEVLLGKMLDEKRITGNHLAPYLRNVDVQWDSINVDELPQMDFSGDDLIRYALRTGDLLVCEGGEPGRAALWRGELHECYYQKALHRLRRIDVVSDNTRFMFYLLRFATSSGVFLSSEGKSTIAHLTAETLRRYRFGFPPRSEQDCIAAFLDRETAKIDALVEEQKRLIELLKEKRQAMISQAVTKGLDPNVPMKDSGVDWLGEVPAHWRVRRLKDHGTLVGGSGFPNEYQGRDDEELPFYKVASLDADSDGRYMSSTQHTVSRESASTLRASIVPSGSILWAKIGAALMLNRRRVTTVPSCIDNNMTAYLPGKEISTAWAYHWTSLLDFGQFANPGAVPSLSEGYQATLPLLVPPPREQDEIAAYIDAQNAAMQSLSAAAAAGVELLLERRAALISAAVTGKIDVRGLVPQPEVVSA